MKQFFDKYHIQILLTGICIVYFCNLFIDIMDVDAAQYASIALEMLRSGSYLQVFHRGADYLDKPPLLFWLSALSFKIFGISNWSYKLPAVLSLAASVYAVYRFTKLWYTPKVAKTAAVILASTQAYFLMTNDVRTDGILTAFVILCSWQISSYLKFKDWKSLILAAIFLGFALLSKGPIAAIVLVLAFLPHLILKKESTKTIDPKWLIFIGIVLLLLCPMLYGLYMQFDLHPEKLVYGLQGPSGIKFFFWTQSFGRITGDIYWSNNTGIFYFLQTILWDLQPWVLLFFAAFVVFIVRFFDAKEYVSFFGFLLPFLALSTSHYKLPHYIFVLFPFAAVLTANFIVNLKNTRTFSIIQFILMHLYFALGALSMYYFFPEKLLTLMVIHILLYFIFVWSFWKTEHKILIPSAIAAIGLGLVMSLSFYPSLLSYQSRSVLGKYIDNQKIAQNQFYTFGQISFALDFYARRTVPELEYANLEELPSEFMVFTSEENLKILDEKTDFKYSILKKFEDFPVSQLHINFLKPEKRKSKLRYMYLVKVRS